jgi:hypothetical protein
MASRAATRVLHRVQHHGIGGFGDGGLVERPERLGDVSGIVGEIEDEQVVLALERVGAVEARERLDGLDPFELLVHEHGGQERLVVAGLILLSDHQHAVLAVLLRI